MTIDFVMQDGSTRQLKATPGMSVMQVAQQNNVPGITADCGGACACGTCHVYVSPTWTGRVGRPDTPETDLLEMVDHCRPESRLSCQIIITPDMDGLIVTVPA